MRPLRTAARTLLSAIFVYGGARAIADPEPLVPRAKPLADRLVPLLEKTDLRVPDDPRTLVRINGAAQVAGGLLLASGRLTRPAAGLLAGTLVPTTLVAHQFWAEDSAAQRQAQMVHFLKNLGLFGGLLLAAADTEGRPGLRWRTGRLLRDTRRSMRRTVRTARREARIARRAVSAGRHLPG
jgi:putative oxidoreductase